MSWSTQFSNKDVVKEYLRRKTQPKGLIDALFDKQKVFNRDKSRFKAALNTRRSGKSFLAATRLITGALEQPRSINPYIALTRDSAKRIIWPILLSQLEAHKIPHQPQESSLTVQFDHKSQIFLVGADQQNFINRLRGIPAKIAVIDEAQSYRDHIQELVDDVLTPALADFNGQLDLYGTPGIRPFGFFYEATTQDRGFSIHKWSVLDNPHIPNAEGFIAELMQRRGWTDQNPTYRREWLGEWVIDEDALLFKFKDHYQVSRLPESSLNRVLGIDFGFHDKTAFVVMAYSDTEPVLYIEHSEAYSEMIPSEIAKFTEMLIKKFNPISIVSDTGGLGKSIMEEMRRRYHIPVKAAEKTDKLTAISLMNGDFIDGRLKVLASNKDLIHQFKTIARGEDGLEEPDAPCDLADAALYTYREAKHWAFEPKKPQLSKYSEEYIEESLEKEFKLRQDRSWWEDLNQN